MTTKLERCIQEVKERNKSLPKSKRVNPFAVCKASISNKRKKKGRKK